MKNRFKSNPISHPSWILFFLLKLWAKTMRRKKFKRKQNPVTGFLGCFYSVRHLHHTAILPNLLWCSPFGKLISLSLWEVLSGSGKDESVADQFLEIYRRRAPEPGRTASFFLHTNWQKANDEKKHVVHSESFWDDWKTNLKLVPSEFSKISKKMVQVLLCKTTSLRLLRARSRTDGVE